MNKITYLPIWKYNATAEERFLELAAVAKEHPERFNKVAVIYQEKLPGKIEATQLRQISSGCNTDEMIGILEQGKLLVLQQAQNPYD